MKIKSIVAGAAIALAATVGSASAGDEFSTLSGVSAESLSSVEMAAVIGADFSFSVVTPAGVVTEVDLGTEAPSAGLMVAGPASGDIIILSDPTCTPM